MASIFKGTGIFQVEPHYSDNMGLQYKATLTTPMTFHFQYVSDNKKRSLQRFERMLS